MANDQLRPHGPKRNHKKGIAAANKERRRQEAKVRQAAYARIPLEQKLAKSGSKERTKLLAREGIK